MVTRRADKSKDKSESSMLLSEQSAHPDRGRRETLGLHTTPEELAQLAAAPDRETRSLVAKHPNTPPQALAQLALDERSDYYTLEMVAANPNTPAEILEVLARRNHYSEWQIRVGVACNPKTGERLLAQLALDADEWVRYYVREHPNTPRECKEKLAADPLPEGYQRFLDD